MNKKTKGLANIVLSEDRLLKPIEERTQHPAIEEFNSIRAMTSDRKSAIESYVDSLFPKEGDGRSCNPLCTFDEFKEQLVGRDQAMIDSTKLLGCSLSDLNSGERRIARNRFWNNWKSISSESAAQTTANFYRKLLQKPLITRLASEFETKASTSAATVLAKERILEWRSESSHDKLQEALELLQFAAGCGDPEASFILATEEVGLENPTNADDDQMLRNKGRLIPKYLCPSESDRENYLRWAGRCGFEPAIQKMEMQKEQASYVDDANYDLWLEHDERRLRDLDDDIKRLKPLAEAGIPDAQWELGSSMHERGGILLGLDQEVGRDYFDAAWMWIEQASKSSSAARHYLAKRESIDSDEAFSLLLSSAFPEEGMVYPPALEDLADAYLAQDDYENAELCLRKAVSHEVLDANLKLARLLIDRNEPDHSMLVEARTLLLAGANSGFISKAESSVLAGLMHLRGEGGPVDLDEAKRLFEAATRDRYQLDDSIPFAAQLALLLGWESRQPGEKAVELILKWLEKHEYRATPEIPLNHKDINLLMAINKHLERSRQDIIVAKVREQHGFDLSRVPPRNCFGLDGDPKLRVICFFGAVKYPSLKNLELSKYLTDEQSMVERYLLGRFAITDRIGKPDPRSAVTYFEIVEKLAKKIEPHLRVGPEEIDTQEFFNWIRDRASKGLVNAKNIELARVNDELAQAKADLEDMMAMFAHKFRGPVDSIIANADFHQENRDHLFKDLGRTMNGLLDIFSFVSSNSEKLLPRLRDDAEGPHTLVHVVHKALWLAIVQLLTKRNVDRMNMVYYNYARKEGRIPPDTTYLVWRKEKDFRDIREAIRTTWELEIASYGNFSDLDGLVTWCSAKLVKIKISGVTDATISFADSGTKESLLLVILTELFVNAIKHYDIKSSTPISLNWKTADDVTVLSCTNPTSEDARKRGEGSGRGLKFLSLIARNVGGHFAPPGNDEVVLASFSFPKSVFPNR